ncbi:MULTISPECIES: hypothetical protein [Acinetobacter]|uniref:hypothetical protein n=1 Tax=Acinetobacter TaxID=469 RepID=UPI000CDC7A70|nr:MULTISPECIES: hypothetical protein [Acinetobacter]AUX89199.1 hypothetical protein C3F22_04735 [Acinetobacter sp. ACNIH1]NGP40466.1 hypothetical protein [Acinetobacter lwoffii]QZD34043.1 hypothetical protein ABEKA_2084 [Acinetobacter lwoffii]
MFELKLKVFSILWSVLKDDLAQNRAYECLKVMCAATLGLLKGQVDDHVAYSRYKLKAAVDGKLSADNVDPKELGKWINERKLNEYLERLSSKHIQKFSEIGYVPVVRTNDTVGGKGNERLFWLDIQETVIESVDEKLVNEEDIEYITYERVDSSAIKMSWFYRFIFKNGEIKNKSIRGLFMLIVLFGGFISWALYVCAFSIVLVREGQNFTTLDLLFIVCLIGFSYLSFKYWFVPMWNLPEHRVIKAPMTFISLAEEHADIEMYRDRERNQLTRVTRFRGICPICSAEVVLRTGQTDHNLPLVGRCVESPFAHVYSFDRVLMIGKLLSR